MSRGPGVRPEDIEMAAKSNLTVNSRGGSQHTGSARARLRRAARMFGATDESKPTP